VGDQTVNDVTITDHYPAQMVLDGSPDVNYWRWWEWEDHPDDHYFTVTLETLEPSWNVDINYRMRIPGDDPIPWGLVLSNTADVTLAANDTNPEDNSATALLGTGPDLYVEKTLTAGQPATSELVTFTLRFGNAQPWYASWWNLQGNAWLSDTLPVGMTYVAAYQRNCGSDEPRWCERPPDEIDGQTLRWQYRLNPGNWNDIRLVAQIDAQVAVPATLVNTAGIASDQPDADIEPFYDNNQASLGVRVLPAETVVYLPLVLHYSAPPAERQIYLPLVLRP
jgi:hypothetical protein